MAKTRRYNGVADGKRASDLDIEAQFKDLLERCDYLLRLAELEVEQAVQTGEPMVALDYKVKS